MMGNYSISKDVNVTWLSEYWIDGQVHHLA